MGVLQGHVVVGGGKISDTLMQSQIHIAPTVMAFSYVASGCTLQI
jgi:hypothetical protein